jgi:23S rRNA (guanosine2251-2'-O)-methyltransferase
MKRERSARPTPRGARRSGRKAAAAPTVTTKSRAVPAPKRRRAAPAVTPKGRAAAPASKHRTAAPAPASSKKRAVAPAASPGKRAAAPGPKAGSLPAAPVRRASPKAAAARGLWLYGRHAVEAALANAQRSCHRLLGTPEALAALGAPAGRPGLEVLSVEREEIDRKLGPGAVHQGLALSVAPLARLELKRALVPESGRNLVLVLDQVNDPHNVGAILRSAAAFDVRALVLPERRSAELGGLAGKAASGALDLVPVIEVTNLARALDQLAELGYWRLALDALAEATIDDAPEVDNLALVLGAEGGGLRRLVREHCDFSARLPIAPAMDSLNVSVACGIALYALAGRRGTAA